MLPKLPKRPDFCASLPALIEKGLDPKSAEHLLHRAIFALDTYELVVSCGSLAIDASGRVPDEGAVAEAGMAFALGKPLIYFKGDDVRAVLGGNDNPILVGLGSFQTVRSIDELGPALEAKIMSLNPDPSFRIACTPHLAATLEMGEQVSLILKQECENPSSRAAHIAGVVSQVAERS
jgi:hypothetical protein